MTPLISPRRCHTVAVVLAAVLPLACTPPAVENPPAPAADDSPGYFRDVTAGSGIAFVHRNGEDAKRFAILESLGGGVALIDYDGDGKLDLFFPGGGFFDGPDKKLIAGYPPKLFRNVGDWKFADTTADAGLDRLADGAVWFYNHGAFTADYDRDGWPDLLMTGYGRCVLWHNEPAPGGGRRFRDVTRPAGLVRPHFWSTGAGFGDLDGDGFPDLYLGNYLTWSNDNDPPCPGYFVGVPRDTCSPKSYDAAPHALYRNRGDGTFEDVSAAAGIRTDRPDKQYGKALGVLFADVDLDGRPDVYVANDTVDNFLFLNKSEPGKLRFADVGQRYGVHRDGMGAPNGSMGLDATDFEGTGRASVWVTNYENELHALYRNQFLDGRMVFTYYTAQSGVAAIGPKYVGFGTAFTDFDRDGWDDIVVNNGHVMQFHAKDFVKQPPVLFRNIDREGRRYFVEDTRAGGPYFRRPHRGRGLAVGDLDDDGRPDLVFCNTNDPPALLRNESFPDRHWLGVELAAKGRADATGARLTLDAGGRKRVRFACAGRSYLSQCDRRFVFGLGESAAVGRLTVEWPSGSPRAEHFDGLTAGKYHKLEQGTGNP